MKSVFQTLASSEEKGENVALCMIIKSRGSTPRKTGSKMLVYPDGHIDGTVGGGETENRVIQEAMEALKDGKSRILAYDLNDPKSGDPGVCGGHVEVFIEPVFSRPTMVIIGAGHVGRALCHLAKWMGFRVVVSDDRKDLCTREVNPDADEFYPMKMSELPQHLKITPQTYLVLTTRGMDLDVEGMPALLDSPAAYMGVIGSKRRWLMTSRALIEAGIPEEKLKPVHSPLGLDIQAETPEEIAISIMGEIIQVMHSGSKKTQEDINGG